MLREISVESIGYGGAEPHVQGLVYIFIALAATGVGGAAYFGLTFSPIEAVVTAVAFGCVAVLLQERALRLRAENRLERAIEDLARLLSTDAQAGAVLSQRINALTDANAGSRLESIEADISVLGTVVRQVAESVNELEEARRRDESPIGKPDTPHEPEFLDDDDAFPEPVIPPQLLKQALDENRLIFHIEPVVTLPQRRPFGYDLVPRLMMIDGELADAPDFMPRTGGDGLIREVEELALDESVVIARRAKTSGQPIRLFVPLTHATLQDKRLAEQFVALLDANRAIGDSLVFAIPQQSFKLLGPQEKMVLQQLSRIGIGYALTHVANLRFDFGELEGLGFKSVRFDATRFLRQPAIYTDFHTTDVAPYAKRFHIELCATGVVDEQQLLALFEDGITLAQGPHIAGPGPVRPDLRIDRPTLVAEPRRAEV
jgi:cyclic-di-GMP phosphodiesterase TipF (flagellum assembly factor)